MKKQVVDSNPCVCYLWISKEEADKKATAEIIRNEIKENQSKKIKTVILESGNTSLENTLRYLLKHNYEKQNSGFDKSDVA